MGYTKTARMKKIFLLKSKPVLLLGHQYKQQTSFIQSENPGENYTVLTLRKVSFKSHKNYSFSL